MCGVELYVGGAVGGAHLGIEPGRDLPRPTQVQAEFKHINGAGAGGVY